MGGYGFCFWWGCLDGPPYRVAPNKNPATKLRKVVVVVFAAASLVEDKCVQTDLPRKLEREENLCRR